MAKSKKSNQDKGFFSNIFGTDDKMSREEAGRKGGKATHVCRGRECNSKSNRSNKNK